MPDLPEGVQNDEPREHAPDANTKVERVSTDMGIPPKRDVPGKSEGKAQEVVDESKR